MRTFSNYFTGRYDAVTYRQVERLRRSLVALPESPREEPLWSAIAAAVLESLEADADVNIYLRTGGNLP